MDNPSRNTDRSHDLLYISLQPYQESKDLPLVYNLSETDYCGLKMRRRFVEKYLLGRGGAEWQAAGGSNHRRINTLNHEAKSFQISKIQMNRSAPLNTLSQLKPFKTHRLNTTTNHPTLLHPPQLQIIAEGSRMGLSSQSKKRQLLASRTQRPATQNNNQKPASRSKTCFRRTKTLSVGKGASSAREGQFTFKGWQNEYPEPE